MYVVILGEVAVTFSVVLVGDKTVGAGVNGPDVVVLLGAVGITSDVIMSEAEHGLVLQRFWSQHFISQLESSEMDVKQINFSKRHSWKLFGSLFY